MKKFLIVGAPRSGTKFIASLLTELNVSCGWETVYRSLYRRDGVEGDWSEAIGESSWLSIGELSELPKDIIVFHQIRNPINVIRSQVSWDIFGKEGANFKIMSSVIKNSSITKNPKDYFSIWCDMNLYIEKFASYRYRVEDIDQEIFNILDMIEADYSVEEVKETLKTIKKDINSGVRGSVNKYLISDLTSSKDGQDLIKKYGY